MPARLPYPVPFFRSLSRRILAAGVCLAMMACPLWAADEEDDTPAPSPAEHIKQLRSDAEKLRVQAETGYRVEEGACYKRFFVNSCIDDAKTERLAHIRRARALEVEAHKLDLVERQAKAAETAKKAMMNGSDSRPTEASSPSADVDVAKPRPEIPASAIRPPLISSNDSERAKAARRAEAAQRDRERYDARIRELEEKKARDAIGQ